MICPKCGNELDLFADKCLSCGKSFKAMSLAERQKLKVKPKINKRAPRRVRKKSQPKTNVTKTRIEYNNGIACKEGMSYTGRKLKKCSFKKKHNNEGTRSYYGFSSLGGML